MSKCRKCGKEINKDYLPSNFCENCVEEYYDRVLKKIERPEHTFIHSHEK